MFCIVRNNLWDWQSLQPTSGAGAQFFEFCDALEVKNGENAPQTGWGLDHALSAWGSYFKDVYYPLSKYSLHCAYSSFDFKPNVPSLW